jgi:hypothetical protein
MTLRLVFGRQPTDKHAKIKKSLTIYNLNLLVYSPAVNPVIRCDPKHTKKFIITAIKQKISNEDLKDFS